VLFEKVILIFLLKTDVNIFSKMSDPFFPELFTKLFYESSHGSSLILKDYWCDFSEQKMVDPKELWKKIFSIVHLFLIKDVSELIVQYTVGNIIPFEMFSNRARSFLNEIDSIPIASIVNRSLQKQKRAVVFFHLYNFLIEFRLVVFEHPKFHSMVMRKLMEIEPDLDSFPPNFNLQTIRNNLNPIIVYN
jgi:hypothetical protein